MDEKQVFAAQYSACGPQSAVKDLLIPSKHSAYFFKIDLLKATQRKKKAI